MSREQKTQLQSLATDESLSAADRYRQMVIGQPSWAALARFEAIMLASCGLTGALGFAARKVLYPKVLGRVGRGTVFGRHMTIRHPHKIDLGAGCIFDDLTVLDAKGAANEGIHIGDSVMLGRHSVVGCKEGNIRVGDRTNIGINCILHSESNLTIGSNVLIASFCYVLAGGQHGFDRVDIPIIQQESTTKGVEVGDNCWLGAGAIVMDGVTIGHDSIIGAGAVVNRDLPPFSIAAGIPARLIRSRLDPVEPSPSES